MDYGYPAPAGTTRETRQWCPAAAGWRKSSRSVNNGACAEVASGNGLVLVRDTSEADGPVLTFTARAWTGFTAQAR